MSDPSGLTIRLFLLAVAAVVALAGCNLHYDLDSVEPTVAASDATLDSTGADVPDAGPNNATGDAGDASSPSDATEPDATDPDAPDAPDGADADVSADADGGQADAAAPLDTACSDDQGSARNCQASFGSTEGECDPLGCNQCTPDKTCMLRLRFDNGVPDAFIASCLSDADIGAGSPGEACSSAADCAPRTLCVNWEAPDPRGRVCSRLCELETGRGCPGGYVCTNPLDDTLMGMGFCTRTCDPTNSTSCSSGLTCAYDPNFPDQTCLREFRCLDNGGFSGKTQGDACDVSALHIDGCPQGLICVPDTSGATCQKICASDNECDTSASCLGAPGGINTCQ